MTWLGVQDLVLGIKRMDQRVSLSSAHLFSSAQPPATCRCWKSLWWWKELNPVLEVSGFRGDSGAEAGPALWSWEKLGGLHGPMSVLGSLWGPWRMQTGSMGAFSALQRPEQGESCGNNPANFMSMSNLFVALIIKVMSTVLWILLLLRGGCSLPAHLPGVATTSQPPGAQKVLQRALGGRAGSQHKDHEAVGKKPVT